jgi:hypothetical protein
MTTASAAPLATALRPALIVQPSPEGAPPWRPALALAASEPPRGRVLLVEPQAIVGLDLQRALREAGWRVIGPAATPADVRGLVARGRLDGAVVDLDDLGEAATEVAGLLDEAGIPFVFLAASRERIPATYRGRPALAKPFGTSEVLAALDRIVVKDDIVYPVATAPVSWPRVFPQL